MAISTSSIAKQQSAKYGARKSGAHQIPGQTRISVDLAWVGKATSSLPSSVATVSTGMVRPYASHHSGFEVMSLTLHKQQYLSAHCLQACSVTSKQEKVLKATGMKGCL